MPGLAAPVEVLFDGHGVPHVYAAGPEDAWYTAGVLHGRDRLWQMELYRRAAYGRLSEILGEATLPIDQRFLTLDLRAAAAEEWRTAGPVVREVLSRYAAGVNDQLQRMHGRFRPLELQVLGVQPAEWTPLDSLAVGRLLAWRLAENHQGELVRHALASQFGADEALRLGGRYPSGAPTVVPEAAGAAGARGREADAHAATTVPRAPDALTGPAAARVWPPGLEWLHPAARRGGSNNWVVSGRRTASGRPLLANDPHLQLEFPGVWYEMHLVAAGLDVIGVGVPGTPFVVLGHNARIAWGMTNSGADVQDLYVERLDLARKRYLADGQWQPVEVMRHEIPVRGGAARAFEVWRTRRGTVFAEVGLDWETPPRWLSSAEEQRGERRVFSLRWDAGGEMASAMLALNQARDWAGFIAAVERFTSPSQNIAYADVEGNIGYAMSGLLPQRRAGAGAFPTDAASSEGDWIGKVASDTLPRVFNPASGYITSSNNLIDRGWPGTITRDWAAPYRAARLHGLLAVAEKVDPAISMAWQADVTTLAADDVLAGVPAALAVARQRGDERAVATLERLAAWDRQADGRPITTLYQLFEDALWRRTFIDEMGESLFNVFYEWAGAERPAGLYAILDDRGSRWFDDIGTIDHRESRDEVYMLAAADADRLMRAQPADGDWSVAHAAHFEHPLAAAGFAFRWLLSRGPVPLTGNSFTVNRVSHHRLRPFAAWEVPSWRQVFDVGQWDDARVVLPAGQSGHPLSPHYFDQNALWRAGQYRQQPYSRRAVDAVRAHRVLLLPPGQ